MKKEIQTKTVCDNCGIEISLNSEIINNGCPKCHSFKFRTMRKMTEKEEQEEEIRFLIEEELSKTDISNDISTIRLNKNGTFEVDLEQLLKDVNEKQPIISRNKDGTYYIKFNEKNKKNIEENEEDN